MEGNYMKNIFRLVRCGGFLFTVFCIFTTTIPLHAQWSQTNGPYGSDISCFAVSGADLFAGTYGGGVFLSTNNGTSWTAVSTGLTNTGVYALAVSGSNLFAGTSGGGVFLSTNNGTSWTAVNTGLINTNVFTLAVSGTNLFAGTFDGGVFISTDNGSNWNAANTGLTDTYVCVLAVRGSNLFVGTWGGGIFLSTDNGTNWTEVNTGLTNTNVWSLAFSGTNLFAGTYGGGVFLSTNNGTSWTEVNTGLTNTKVNALAVSGSNLFAGTYGGGVFLSTNNGTSWTAVNTGLTNTDVRALTISGMNLFVGTNGGRVFIALESALPVELISFTGQLNGSGIVLNWETATEVNNYGFEVERRAEGSSAWAKVGFVSGAGTSNSSKNYIYQDVNLAPGVYVYRIKQIDNDGTFKYSASTQVDAGISARVFQLFNNYPNPFNPTTEIRFSVPETGLTTLKIYNTLGQQVATLFSDIAQPGHYISVTFNAEKLASGVYFYRITAGDFTQVKKMLLVK